MVAFVQMLMLFILLIVSPTLVHAQSVAELENRIKSLESELSQTRAQLQQAINDKQELMDAAPVQVEAPSDKMTMGPFKIGGAIRANYVIGDYEQNSAGPSRGGHGGDIELDVFRFQLDYEHENWVGMAQYRFYDGYNMLHTGWLGYNFDDGSQVQAGVNRVPFGPGPYGVSNSWFFDQHYYVGLADDMDLGVKYSKSFDDLKIDLGYYVADEGDYRGKTEDSARYSYDVVNEAGTGYEEEHQLNLRGIYSFNDIAIPTDLGLSAQYGLLETSGAQGDGEHYALSSHMINKWNNWTLASQLTYYDYNIGNHSVQSGVVTDDLIDMGAFDFAYPVAARGLIPAVALSYMKKTPSIAWLDYVMPYVEYSSLQKRVDGFNDSDLVTIGAAWARGDWYINTDLAYSNGNFFVGNEQFTELGANPNDHWQSRLNIHIGYYF